MGGCDVRGQEGAKVRWLGKGNCPEWPVKGVEGSSIRASIPRKLSNICKSHYELQCPMGSQKPGEAGTTDIDEDVLRMYSVLCSLYPIQYGVRSRVDGLFFWDEVFRGRQRKRGRPICNLANARYSHPIGRIQVQAQDRRRRDGAARL